MDRNKLLLADYLDIVFDGRNKAYGGYELRRRYTDRARRATLAVILCASLAASAPLLAEAFSGKAPVMLPQTTAHNTTLLDLPKPKEQPRVPVIEPPAPPATIRNPVLRIVRNEEADVPPAAVEDLVNRQIALQTGEGTLDNPDILPTGPAGTGHLQVESPALPKEVIPEIVEQMPQFDGDLKSFLNQHLRYPESARQIGEEGRVGIHFVVNEDGSISMAEVTRSAAPVLDAEALRVVRSMPRWKPGKQNGKAVKVYFTLPITFTLE